MHCKPLKASISVLFLAIKTIHGIHYVNIPTIDFNLCFYKANWGRYPYFIYIEVILALMKVACSIWKYNYFPWIHFNIYTMDSCRNFFTLLHTCSPLLSIPYAWYCSAIPSYTCLFLLAVSSCSWISSSPHISISIKIWVLVQPF